MKTCLQALNLKDHDAFAQVNSVKQAAAFPPNFIHSLDASHMMLTAIACKNDGLTFAAVHDSFWTHACDVDKLGVNLREAFVNLYKQNIMKSLKDEFEYWNQGHKIPVSVSLSSEQMKQWKSYLVDNGRGNEARSKRKDTVVIWIDLELPKLPSRGNFDLEMVKSSKYFFH